MNADPDRLPDHMATALDLLADEDAAHILADARAGANARVRTLLEQALVERLLARAVAAESASPIVAEHREPDDESGDRDDEQALYLYGVVAADASTATGATDAPGVGPGSRIEAVAHGRLAAVVSRVPLSEFGDEHLKQNLEQMDWLERTARQHEAVLDAIREHTTVIPMRICTLFRDCRSVREMLDHEAEPLQRALDKLTGRNEWGVKVLVSMVDVRRGLATADDRPAAPHGPTTGRGYLETKQAERRTADQARAWITEAVSEVHTTLTGGAAAALRNPVQPRELSGYQDEMALNAAYLVSDSEHQAFAALVAELDQRYRPSGLRLEMTGPWPAYNFIPPLGAT